MPTFLDYLSTCLAGLRMGVVVLTWDEYVGLMGNLLAPQGQATGQARLTDWLAENGAKIGCNYASELARHYARAAREPSRTCS